MKTQAKPDTTPRGERNRPLRTISISTEAWDMLEEVADAEARSRSGMIERMIRAAHARLERKRA